MLPANPYMPMPPMPNDIADIIKKHVDNRLDEVMHGKDEKLQKEFKKFISSMMPHDGKEDEHISHKKSPMEALYCKLHHYQKEIHQGKSIMDIEKELHEHHTDLSNDEKRVFSSLLRADGPYTLAGMIGIDYDTYIEHMKCLGERFID